MVSLMSPVAIEAGCGNGCAGDGASGLIANHRKGSVMACGTCNGSSAVIADLEDLCPYIRGVQPVIGSCFGACVLGPNCIVEASTSVDKSTESSNQQPASHAEVMKQLLGPSGTAPASFLPFTSNEGSGQNGRLGRDGKLVTRISTFEKNFDLLREAAGDNTPSNCSSLLNTIPEAVLERARLRSDALRGMQLGDDGTGMAWPKTVSQSLFSWSSRSP